MPPQSRNNSFFPSNARLPAHLANTYSNDHSTISTNLNDNHLNSPTQPTATATATTPLPYTQPTHSQHYQNDVPVSNTVGSNSEHNYTISPIKSAVDNLLNFDIDALLKQNDKLLLIIIALVLYKEKADWSTIIAVLYLVF